MSIKGSYILFFKRNTSSNLLEFFIIDCYAGIRLPNPSNILEYKEITNTNTLDHPDPVEAIENYYSTRTIGPIIERSNIATICYGKFNVYVSPHYENNNIVNLSGDPVRADDDFNFTNLPGGGFEICDNRGISPTRPPELNNACRETSEELGINEETLRRFLMENNSLINIDYNEIQDKKGRIQLVYIFIVDLDRIKYENPNAYYTDIQMILTERVTNPASIPSRTPHVNEYYRARWIPESDTIPDATGNIPAGKVYTDKFKATFNKVMKPTTIRDLSAAQKTWTKFVPPAPPTGDQLLALLTESQKISLKDHINLKIRDKQNIPKRKIYNEIEKYLISINQILNEDELIAFTEELFKINPLNANRNNIKWKQKYLKYKQKYLELKKQLN
jgi:hypothetical protein